MSAYTTICKFQPLEIEIIVSIYFMNKNFINNQTCKHNRETLQ
jgi:hypothetical protein